MRLRLVIGGRDVGLTLYEIRQILDSYRKDDIAEQNRIAVQFFRKRLAAVKEQRARVDDQIGRLEEACERLSGGDSKASAATTRRRAPQTELRTGTH